MNLTRYPRGIFAAAALSAIWMAQPADASILITIMQQGSDVVATGSGSANMTDLDPSFSGQTAFSEVSGIAANAIVGSTSGASYAATFYYGVTGPLSFGTGGYFYATSGSGDNFGVDMANHGNRLWLPGGYHSGNALSATDTWSNTTISALGLTPGVYDYSWGSGDNADTLEVRIGVASAGPVPEVATWAMMLTGFALLGAVSRRRPRMALSYR